MTPSVTIAIPTRGDRPTIDQTIQSVLASANGNAFELLIVWSGHMFPPEWSRVLLGDPRHIAVSSLGLSLARNAALQSATGDLVLMPDDDVICSRPWFGAAVSALMEGADIVGGPVTCVWPAGRRPAWLSVEMATIFGSFGLGTEPENLVLGQGLTGGNMGMRRQTILALGGYNVSLGAIGRGGGMGEENDLCDRALRSGLQVTYVPDARVDHMIGGAAATRRNYLRRMYRFGRSMEVVRRHEGPGTSRKLASAAQRIVRAAFVKDCMAQLGSACFEIGSVRASFPRREPRSAADV